MIYDIGSTIFKGAAISIFSSHWAEHLIEVQPELEDTSIEELQVHTISDRVHAKYMRTPNRRGLFVGLKK